MNLAEWIKEKVVSLCPICSRVIPEDSESVDVSGKPCCKYCFPPIELINGFQYIKRKSPLNFPVVS